MKKTNKQNRLKRSLAFLLAFAMLFTTCTVNAIAADSTGTSQQTNIADGVYRITADLYHCYAPNQLSMGNGAVRGSSTYNEKHTADDASYQPLLVVENGEGTLIMDYMAMGYLTSYGYLLSLDTLKNVTYKNSIPDTYELVPAEVLTEHRMTDGTIAVDAYNDPSSRWVLEQANGKAYPHTLAVPVTLPETTEMQSTDFVHVFVPVMESITEGTGDQLARLKLGYSEMSKVNDLSGEVEYWLYQAIHTGRGAASDEDWQNLCSAIAETKEKLSNTLTGITVQNQTPVRQVQEMSVDERKAQVTKLQNAIEKIEAAASVEKWDGTTVEEPQKDGTTIYVKTAAELAWVAEQVNAGTTDVFNAVVLENDIDLNNKEWTPIGTSTQPFSGTFEGRGHVISNLKITVNQDYTGLFGCVKGSRVEPAVLQDISISGEIHMSGAKNVYVGGIVGRADYTNMTDCINKVNITSAAQETGGIAGYAYAASVQNCKNYGNITAQNNYVGGIIGWAIANTNIENSVNKGTVSGLEYVGGIVGHMQGGPGMDVIRNLSNQGAVNGTDKVGGIVGMNTNARGEILHNSATVSGNGKIGGIAGSTSNSEFFGVFSVGTLSQTQGGTADYKPGALVGGYAVNSIQDSYALEGDCDILVANNAIPDTVAFKTEEWFKSDAFYTAMKDYAQYFAPDPNYADQGMPIPAAEAEEILTSAKERALQELQQYKESDAYRGLSKTAVEKLKAETAEAIRSAANVTAITEKLAQAKEEINAIPNDANYGLNVDALKERLAEWKAEAAKGIYTDAAQEKLEQLIGELESGLENGFGTQDAIDKLLESAETTVEGLEKKPVVPGEPTTPQRPVTPQPTPGDTVPVDNQNGEKTIRKGQIITAGDLQYRVKSVGKTAAVEVIGAKVKKSVVSIPAAVTANGVTFKVTSIAAKAFQNNKKVTTVKVGSNVRSIGANAFYKCTNLKKLTLGKNVKSVGAQAFSKCTKLTKVTIPSKVTKIGKKAFYGDKKLKTVTIKSKKIKTVGKKALSGIHKKATVKMTKLSKKQKKALSRTLKKSGIAKTVKIK